MLALIDFESNADIQFEDLDIEAINWMVEEFIHL